MSVLSSYLKFSIGIWIRALISFFTTPIITWLIEPSIFGRSSLFLAANSIFLTVVMLGSHMAYMRFYPRKGIDKNTLLWSSLIVPLMIFAVSSIIILFLFKEDLSVFLVNFYDIKIDIIFIVTALLSIFEQYTFITLRMQMKGLTYSVLQILQSLIQVFVIVSYSFLVSRDVYSILYATIASKLLTILIGIYTSISVWFPIKINKTLIMESLKYSYPFIFSGIVWFLVNWTDRFMLRIFSDFKTVGLYSAAFKLISVSTIIVSGFSTIWYPIAYKRYEENPEDKGFFLRIFNFMVFTMLALLFLLLTFKDVVFLLLAKTYRPAAQIAPFLLLSPLMLTLASIVARGIDFYKKTYWFIISDGIAAVYNILGNYILIPILGAKGAAISTGTSFIIVFTIEAIVSTNLYNVNYNFTKMFVGLVLFIISSFLHTFISHSFVPYIVSSISLVVVIVIYRTESFFLAEELKSIVVYYLKRVFNRKKINFPNKSNKL
ncbi:polysaccharide biosynthesis protein [Thermosipho ferrireducens]|uniref:Polysaccharide biosynthesis protein n=1 Tax=Thermosipho ferrireducens TaxID=2571116 RepID=A0ABX7SB42_9BACT|nr:oligosaccharide flippase family protein [Thermosipho ferrireducens]QTA38565.1 polysaccharide biosynthesis protein [Thermosipho ferrireducens]